MKAFLQSLYLNARLYAALSAVAVLFVMGYFFPPLVALGQPILIAVGALLGIDLLLLYRSREGVIAAREVPERLSNGDENEIGIALTHRYQFSTHLTVVDELPVQFQVRDAQYTLTLPPQEKREVRYTVRPVERGVYAFGALNVFARSPLGLVSRRYRFDAEQEVPVYPSFLQMRKYELLAISNRLEEIGIKKMRRIGHTMEFDHIREYVVGDDVRTVNWKATARRGSLMVNQYQDERAQPVYCLLDMGRVMKMPFEGMTLLDFSINASLVLSNIALLKQDRAGLIAFSQDINVTVPARRKAGQMQTIQEALYNLQTDFLESDYARLYVHLRRHIRQRSLLLLFTNFETRSSMQRQLSFLRALARQHVVVAVFFENTELQDLLASTPKNTEQIYIKTIAEKFAFEKREIVEELRRHGIQAILTPPKDLSVNTINKYLELKARGMI